MKLLEEFKELHFIGYRKNQVKSKPTEDNLFLVSRVLKNKNHVILR